MDKKLLQNRLGALLVGIFMVVTLSASMHHDSTPPPQLPKKQTPPQETLYLLLQQAEAGETTPALLNAMQSQIHQLESQNASLKGQEAASHDRSTASLLARATTVIAYATIQQQLKAVSSLRLLQSTLKTTDLPEGSLRHYFTKTLSQQQRLLLKKHTYDTFLTIEQETRQARQTLLCSAIVASAMTAQQQALSWLTLPYAVATVRNVYPGNWRVFNTIRTPAQCEALHKQVTIQEEQVQAYSVMAFPVVAPAYVNAFAQRLMQMKKSKVDVERYQRQLQQLRRSLPKAVTEQQKVRFLLQCASYGRGLQLASFKSQTTTLLKKLEQRAQAWTRKHPYLSQYDGQTYALNNAYMHAGIGIMLEKQLKQADSLVQVDHVVQAVEQKMFLLRMFEENYGSKTAFNKVHATDRKILKHEGLQQKMVLLVSLAEQAMRVYRNGRLVKAFYVTTGRRELPSLPGVWTALERRSPTIFKAGVPEDSPYWFPDTPISYAILYHRGGFFVHDAPWRATFGPGTQFPHEDAAGTTNFNRDGSHGCINLTVNDARWVYAHTDKQVRIVVY